MTIKNLSGTAVASYEAPALKMLEIQSEGLLCASGFGVDNFGIKDWETDNDDILEF
ncbi:MAG: hypothetical protein J6A22_06785 [Bacteroidales bacterium]|nr:hypothetical protein [Bacteroidales bacterium]